MIEVWSQGNAQDNMPPEMLVEMRRTVQNHPWWDARGRLTLSLLHQLGVDSSCRVMDVGCGWGTNLKTLTQAGIEVAGMDISRQMLDCLVPLGLRLIECDITQPLADDVEQFDAVLALDVIEHLDDDAAAVRNLARLTRPGGHAIVSVPALPELFSEYDSVQGHRRRYLEDQLCEAFHDSGFHLDRMLWWGQWLVPLVKHQRGRSKRRPGQSDLELYRSYLEPPRWPISLALRWMFRRDHRRALLEKNTTGTSLFAIATKQPQHT